VAVLSSANSWMYASSRMLFSQAREGFAFKQFGYVNRRGIPIYALLATTIIGIAVWLLQFVGEQAYSLLISASGLSGFIAWLGIAISHYRFRKAFVAQGHDLKELKYHAAWYPFGPIFAIILSIIVIGGQDINAIVNLDWMGLLIAYMSLPIVLGFYIYYELKYGSKIIPLKEVDLSRRTKGESFDPDAEN
ncbi:MAG: amino acid permease, partial [Limosilactobacillus sp.]|nr:amino acid permease [Limosilactobacillus sp.]